MGWDRDTIANYDPTAFVADYKEFEYDKNVDDFVKTKSKDAPEGFLLSKAAKDSYKKGVSIQSFDEVAKRCGWRSYRSLLRVAKRFGVSFEIERFVRK